MLYNDGDLDTLLVSPTKLISAELVYTSFQLHESAVRVGILTENAMSKPPAVPAPHMRIAIGPRLRGFGIGMQEHAPAAAIPRGRD